MIDKIIWVLAIVWLSYGVHGLKDFKPQDGDKYTIVKSFFIDTPHDTYEVATFHADLGHFGASQVIITLKNMTRLVRGELMLYYFPSDTRFGIDVSPGEDFNFNRSSTYNITNVINFPGGSRPFAIELVVSDIKDYNIGEIYFLQKRLERTNWYCLVPVNYDYLTTTVKYRNNGDPVLYYKFNNTQNTGRQIFNFLENDKGEYKILSKPWKKSKQYDNKNGSPDDRVALEVREPSKKIGSRVMGAQFPGSDDNLWSFETGKLDKSFKIKSRLTQTCMSAINGFGGNIVMADCEKGIETSWFVRYCDG